MTPEEFYQALEAFNISLSEQQKEQFETYPSPGYRGWGWFS